MDVLPRLYLNFDPSHLVWMGIDPVQALRPYVDRVAHAQATGIEVFPDQRTRYGWPGRAVDRPDPWDVGWWRYRLPGLGQVDWTRVVDPLYQGGFDGVLSVEHEDPLWGGNENKIEIGLRVARQTLRPLLVREEIDMTPDQGFFDPHQRETVAAAMARIIPTDDTPGAREASTIDFLDRYLSGIDYLYAKPDGSGFETLEGKRAWAWQQRIDILRDTYVRGITELDRRSRVEYGADFAQLTGRQQDWVLADLERSATDDGGAHGPALQQSTVETALAFVPLLALHTRQGFYADPIYGGNKDKVGWEVIGFPGPESLADVHCGRYSVLDHFADSRGYPGTEDEHDGR
jgi:gluconate 2-dehydrogenase gamma chain